MADKKFSELTAATSLDDSDYVPVVASGVNKTITKANLRTTLGAAASWQTLTLTSKFLGTVPAKRWDGSAFQTISNWASGSFVVGNFVKPTSANGYCYECVSITTGTSGGSEPSWGTTPGANTTDGGVTWRCRRFGVIETASDLSSEVNVGMPIRYTYNSTVYYGIVIGISSSYIAVAGAGMLSNQTLTTVEYASQDRVVNVVLNIAGDYGPSVQDILGNVGHQYLTWQRGRAHLVQYDIRHRTNAGTTQPKLNIKLAGTAVCDNDSGNGISASTTRQIPPYVSMNPSAYTVNKDDAIEVNVTAAAVGTAVADLSTVLVFVLE